MTRRATVDVGGVPISYLTAGEGGPLVLLLHGTYWSRVWQPVLDGIAAAGLRPVAVDFPGFGRSGGELTLSEASVPRLSAWLVQFLDALGHQGPVMVAGHDIGGGVAQHLMLANKVQVPRVAVVNGIMYDSWPVPGVARFRDPAVGAADHATPWRCCRLFCSQRRPSFWCGASRTVSRRWIMPNATHGRFRKRGLFGSIRPATSQWRTIPRQWPVR